MTAGGQELPSVAALMHKAYSDEKIMGLAWISESILCYHAREAVAHLLVALLIQLKVSYKQTESLSGLRSLLEEHGETLPSTAIILEDSTDFTAEYRYDRLSPTECLDRQKLAEGVRVLREYVTNRLADLALPT